MPTSTESLVSGDLEVIFKDGCDNAVLDSKLSKNAKSMVDAKEHIFQYGIPYSYRSFLPVYLIKEKETEKDLLSDVIQSSDKAREELCAEGLSATVKMVGYDVKITIKDRGNCILG